MKTSEIIDGLEDLIQDRKSFATPANDKFYGENNPFRYDIEVLQAAIDELNCRTEPENKVLTNADCIRTMSDEKLAEIIYNISTNMCCDMVCTKPIHRSNECKPGHNYNCRDRILSWLRRRPEGSETP